MKNAPAGSPVSRGRFLFATLRSHPRFCALLKKMSLEEGLTDRNLNRKNRRSTASSLSETGRYSTQFPAIGARILESAAAEAERLDHHYVGTEHLLLGIPRET